MAIARVDPFTRDGVRHHFGENCRVTLELWQDAAYQWPSAEFCCALTDERIRVEGEWAEPAAVMFAEMFGPIYKALLRAHGTRKEFAALITGAGRRIMQTCYEASQARYGTRMSDYDLLVPRGWLRHDRAIDIGGRPAFSPQAEAKAEETLHRYLNADQKKDFKKSKTFTVQLPSGPHAGFYRINQNRSFNCEKLETGEKFCVVPDTRVPICDQMLTTKLLLEGDAERFFKTANRMGPNPITSQAFARHMAAIYGGDFT